jgi:CRISPR-associated endonuclease/helicase Cas3
MTERPQKPVDWSFDDDSELSADDSAESLVPPSRPTPASASNRPSAVVSEQRARDGARAATRTGGASGFDEFVFDRSFRALTGTAPFPWQRALFGQFVRQDASQRFPDTCDIPTGLGKTSVIALWLLALAHHTRQGTERTFPRRLVYVVNRRTVVDQSTREAELLRSNLAQRSELEEIASALRSLAARSSPSPLAISTLRGEFADNAEWRNDPARPSVIVGTVDMIGSRLLFSGYGRGFKSRPLHAAFLAQDAVLVHDEAHLEPAFQVLLETLRAEQQRNAWERGRFQVMALSATARSRGQSHTITDEDLRDETVHERVHAKKQIAFHEVADDKKVAEKVLELALSDGLREGGKAILIFVRQVRDVLDIKTKLGKAKQKVETLTGTLRGFERDRLVVNPCFARFMPTPGVTQEEGTVYLVCTSAGEVGVNISADHLICDLSTFDSMAQRFGRVHRFGRPNDHVARVEIVCSMAEPKDDDELGQRIKKTRAVLETLGGDASPAALMALPAEERLAAFSPQPEVLPATGILFDAWALTSIRGLLPGRPPVDDYLHGVSEYEPPQTQVAWRTEVERVVDGLLATHPPDDLLDDFPLKSHEWMTDRTDRVLAELVKIAARNTDEPVWIVERDRPPSIKKLGEVLTGDKKRDEATFRGRTVLLPPRVGGLAAGLLDGAAEYSAAVPYDVADRWFDENKQPRRLRTDSEQAPPGMRLVRRINLSKSPEERAEDEPDTDVIWRWYVEPRSADDDGSRTARAAELLKTHLQKARQRAAQIAGKLLDGSEARAVEHAAEWHDLGKSRRVWQRSIGNTKSEVLAKSGPKMKPRELTRYRHEFGSVIDLAQLPEFMGLTSEERELVLHLIAAHHGRARPHFPVEEAFDPERPGALTTEVARAVPGRFAALQDRYGRWGLAYLESLVRAADALASQDIESTEESEETAE